MATAEQQAYSDQAGAGERTPGGMQPTKVQWKRWVKIYVWLYWEEFYSSVREFREEFVRVIENKANKIYGNSRKNEILVHDVDQL